MFWRSIGRRGMWSTLRIESFWKSLLSTKRHTHTTRSQNRSVETEAFANKCPRGITKEKLRTKTKAALSKQIPNKICLASYMCSSRCLSHVSNVFSIVQSAVERKKLSQHWFASLSVYNTWQSAAPKWDIDFVYLSAAFVPSFGAGPRQIDSKRSVWCVWLVSFVNAYGNLCCRPLNWLLSHCANEICQMLRRIVREA